MAQGYELLATPRDRVGKGSARALRRDGKIPAVVYGDGKPPITITLTTKDATKNLHTGGFMNTVGTINLNGEKISVLPRDYQLHPVKDYLLHIDFLRISEKSRVTVEVPVKFINEDESPGLKRGGALNVVRYTIEMECPANSIPDSIVIDLTGLEIGDSVHISAVTLPENVIPTISDRDFTIATIAGAGGQEEEEEEVDEEAEGEGEEKGEEAEGDKKEESPDKE